MNNPTLYILTGLPYSGKTTLRKELVKRFGFQPVSVDEIMEERNMWREGNPTMEDWGIAYSEAYKQIDNYLTHGKTVIFDCGNLPVHERENARNIAEKLHLPHVLIYVNTPKEEIMRRRKENEQTQVRGHLDDNTLQVALRQFVEPTENEHPILYNQQMNLEEWLKKYSIVCFRL